MIMTQLFYASAPAATTPDQRLHVLEFLPLCFLVSCLSLGLSVTANAGKQHARHGVCKKRPIAWKMDRNSSHRSLFTDHWSPARYNNGTNYPVTGQVIWTDNTNTDTDSNTATNKT